MAVSQTINDDSKLIDSLTYMASLASNPNAISPMLDEMRVITSQMASPTQQLSETDKSILLHVRQRLSDYLINQDPVRAFTKESLEQKLSQRSKQFSRPNRRALKELLTIVFGAFAIYAGIVMLLPEPNTQQRLILAAPVFGILLNAGIAWFFLTARKGFSTEIRKAYGFFCAAMVVSILSSFHFPIVSAFPELRDTSLPLLRYGGSSTIFLLTYILFYWGLRTYALRINKPSILTKPSSIMVGSVALVATTALLTLNLVSENPVIWFIASLQFLPAFFGIVSFIIGMNIVRSTTRLYALPIRLLAYSMLGWAIAFVGSNLLLLSSNSIPVEVGWLLIVGFSTPQFLEFASAYYFKKSATE